MGKIFKIQGHFILSMLEGQLVIKKSRLLQTIFGSIAELLTTGVLFFCECNALFFANYISEACLVV
jgi:hypothetical protein